MTSKELEALFSREPASFVFTDAPPAKGHVRRIGTSEGVVIEVEERAATMIAIFPPDRQDVAARNGTLMQLLLVALRRDWTGGSAWLSGAMRDAARHPEANNYARQVSLKFDQRHSRATLRVEMV